MINNLGKGGAERLILEVLPIYQTMGIEISLLQISDRDSEPTYLKILQEKNIPCYSLGRSSVYQIWSVFKLAKFLRLHRFDLIHVHLFPALYWVALASKFLKITPLLAYTEHNTTNKRANKTYLIPVERWIYSHYNTVVAISEKVRESLLSRRVATTRIELIMNGVNVNTFSLAKPYSIQYLEQEYGLPKESVKMMMTARLKYPKDHQTLINALDHLPTNFVLLLTGEGPEKYKLLEYVRSKNLSERVRFLGFRMDIPNLMKSVDINILSSRYEGMSGVALEALASGKPFLGSDVPGINDVVPDKAMLFEAGNSRDLAAAVTRLMSLEKQEKDKIIALGYDHANKHSLTNMAKNYHSLYKRLLSN